jgi:hypothetical protein
MTHDAQCCKLSGQGKNNILATADEFPNKENGSRGLLKGIKAHRRAMPPELSIGDSALGFRTALREIFPGTQTQRCWVHKWAKVLGAIPNLCVNRPRSTQSDHIPLTDQAQARENPLMLCLT